MRDLLEIQELMDVQLESRDEELWQFWSQSQADGVKIKQLSK